MIITYPIHLPYVAGTEQRVVPDALYHQSEILSGSYPMGKNRFWHGGVHLHPADRNTPIRAIAAGELVAYRYDDTDTGDELFEKASYSRSFILLRHETELGQTSLGTSKLVFYSLYMHLRAWSKVKEKSGEQAINFLKKRIPERPRMKNKSPLIDKQGRPIMEPAHDETVLPAADGQIQLGTEFSRVQRGDVLGYCGSIPDNLATPSQGIHFEIFFEDPRFLQNPMQAIWGKCWLTASLRVLDELLVKHELEVDPEKPLIVVEDKDKDKDKGGCLNIQTEDKKNWWIEKDQFVETEVPADLKKRKAARKAYMPTGKRLIGYVKNPVTNARTLEAGTLIVPWSGPWLNAGEFQERQYEGKLWIQIFKPDQNKIFWAEKNAVKYLSDADWKDFRKVEEHGQFSTDGFMDDEGLQRLIQESQKGHTETKAAQSDKDELVRHVVTRHPTEWSNQGIAQRYERVTKEDFGAQKLTQEQFQKLIRHIERQTFWEKVPGLPDARGVWHVHPIKFIEHLAKCMWLSKEELALVYPSTGSLAAATISHGTSEELREKYRAEINKCCFKYGLNRRLRMAHFFGQAAVESESLNRMLERSDGSQYEGRTDIGNITAGDGRKFKGRGIKQLTGRYNYAEYWSFRGWLKKGGDFDVGWEVKKKDGTNESKLLRPPHIANPNVILEEAFNCVDIGTWYVVLLKPPTISAMDLDDVRAVTHAINGGRDNKEWEKSSSLEDRISHTKRIKKVML